jgi:hypothetical protein
MTVFDTFLSALSRAPNLDGILGDECVEYPPNEHVDYWATPKNAVVFGWMGCDGVHYAILKIDGELLERSPVIQIGPMDFDEPYSLLAPSFTDYLAIGCGATPSEIQRVVADEAGGRSSLLDYMRLHFKQSRFWSEGIDHDIGPYVGLIIPKPNCEPSDAPKSPVGRKFES